MCGLVFSTDKSLSKEVFKKAIKSINHRGPDDNKIIETSKAWLAFARLAIMDLSHHGDQPFMKNETYYLCNGEIYNYLEFKKEFDFEYKSGSDCEVLIPLFEKLGMPKMYRSSIVSSLL